MKIGSQLIFFLLISLSLYCQKVTLSGYVYEKESKESLISAFCFDTLSRTTSITNSAGFFSMDLPQGEAWLQVSFLGCQDSTFFLNLKKDTVVVFYLGAKHQLVDEIYVSARKTAHEQTILGKTVLQVEDLRKAPSFLGETDIMKSIANLPGISLGQDGKSNIYVRGGDRGQNLILLDGAKLYNTNHLGGFLSLLNADVLKQVDVYKGGFPSRFGGRASSVIDIYTRDGNKTRFKSKLNLGLVTSSVLFEGPIGEKVSFIVAARASLYDLFAYGQKLEMKKYGQGSYFTFRVFDLNTKITYQVDKRNKLYFSGFSGSDHFINQDITRTSTKKSSSESNYGIGTITFSAGHLFVPNPKLFLKSSVSYCLYQNMLNISLEEKTGDINTVFDQKSSSQIREAHAESRLEWYASGGHAIKGGVEMSAYQFIPGQEYTYHQDSGNGSSQDTTTGFLFPVRSIETAIYFEDEWQLCKNNFLNLGLRQIWYHHQNQDYYRTEPRISFRSAITEDVSVKANYTLMNQFNHVIVSNYSLYEKEIWLASTDFIPPQQAQQVACGVVASVKPLKMNISTELYYKTMSGLLEYQIPVNNDFFVDNLEQALVKGGIGKAYGLELQASYSDRHFSIDASYVYSRNFRKFQQLNNKEWYPFMYDRPHDFSCLLAYNTLKNYSFGLNFFLSSGIPVSLPEGFVTKNDYSYLRYYAYSGLNNQRFPLYHRLDLSVEKKTLTKRGNQQSFRLNIFNVYARQNPVMIYFERNTGKLKQKSMYSIIPSINYTIEF